MSDLHSNALQQCLQIELQRLIVIWSAQKDDVSCIVHPAKREVLPCSTYDLAWREAMLELLDQLESEHPEDPEQAPKVLHCKIGHCCV